MSDPVKVKLTKPVEHNGETYEELTFREPLVEDYMTACALKDPNLIPIGILAAISGVPMPAFRKITMKDLAVIMEETKNILGNDPIQSMENGGAQLQ